MADSEIPSVPHNPAAAVPKNVCTVCGHIRAAGGRALLVGGCVRDLLLGRPPKEWDIEVFGLDAEQVERLFVGQIDFVGKSFGIYHFRHLPIDLGLPRRERCHGVGHRDFAVAVDPRLSPLEAAKRRDFTINAIYLDPLGGELLDPVGGLDDLKKKCLRAVSEQFSEDALRVLRAMQFIARLNFDCDEDTLKKCRALTADNLSPERVFCEFRKLILHGRAIGHGLQFLYRCHWLRFFPELESLCHCPQNATFHPEGNVWEHVKAAMDVFASIRSGMVENDALVVGLAVLCHDLGKPCCTIWDGTGQPRARGHEMAGMAPAIALLNRLRVPRKMVKEILPLVTWHMVPRTFADRRLGCAAVRRLAWNVGRIDRLLLVAHCDAWGRPPAIPDCTGEERLRKLAEEEGVLANPPQPLVRGRDLAQKFSLAPSPTMGKILALLFEDQLGGKFSSREDGLCRAAEVIHALDSP
ncbi:MAG: polynucleotide adenylyltransferase [Puniceicoccales bacterium]|nr:polynucleotide adenylyltransferase [Puniceicoccales bacterium]